MGKRITDDHGRLIGFLSGVRLHRSWHPDPEYAERWLKDNGFTKGDGGYRQDAPKAKPSKGDGDEVSGRDSESDGEGA